MKKFLALSLSDVVFIMLINVKMPTIVGILAFMSRINFLLSWVEHEKSFITSGLVFSQWALFFFAFVMFWLIPFFLGGGSLKFYVNFYIICYVFMLFFSQYLVEWVYYLCIGQLLQGSIHFQYTGPSDIKQFSCSTEHEISTAHKN